ncbi:MAG: hypothetical protein GY940_23315, partial [bacterium]|nr:hypothetical protein [bacterium]
EADAAETSQKLESLSKSIRQLRTALEPNRDFHELRDRVVKEVAQLKELVEASDIPSKKGAEAAIAKLSEAAEKIANLKGPEQLQELRRIVAEEIKPNLTELRETVNRNADIIVPGSQDQQRVEEINQRTENLDKAIDITLKRSLPGERSQAVRSAPPAPEPPRDFHELREQVIKEITQLKALAEELDIPDKKEVEAVIAKLSKAAEKISNLKGPEQLQELRRIVNEEVKPNLPELREVVQRSAETVASGSQDQQRVEELKQRVDNLEKTVDIVLRKPVPPQPRGSSQLDALLERFETTLRQVSQRPEAPPPPERTVETQQTPPEPVRTAVEFQKEINIELARLTQALEPIPRGEPLPEDIKPRVEQLVERVDTTLRELPESYKTKPSEEFKALFNELRHFRISLDVQRDFQEVKDRLVQEIVRLKALAEDLDIPAKKEVEATIAKLSEAAEKISRLKGPEQLPELRRIVADEVKPNLSNLGKTLNQALETAAPGSESQQRILEMTQRTEQVQQLQRDIDIRFPKLPDSPPLSSDTDNMIKAIENALTKMSEASQSVTAASAGEAPQFSESIETIYENIKTALRLLQNNLRVSGNQLEIPEEIRQVFQNLQSDLKAAEAADRILEQVTQLKEMIQNSQLPIEKVIHEVVESLNDIITRISDLKEQNKFQQLRALVQKQLGPELKMLSSIFGNEKLMNVLEPMDQQSSSAIHGAVSQLQTAIETAFVKGEPINQSSELAQLSEITEKLASLPGGNKGTGNPAGNAPETIKHLSQNIEELLSRLPKNPSSLNNGTAIPAKIRSLLSTLQSHFEPLDIGKDALKLVPKLKSFVEDSGVFFEKKVGDIITKLTDASSRIQNIQTVEQLPEIRSIIDNDMKPNLLQLRELLTNDQALSQLGDAKSLDSIRSAVEDLLSNIGNQQERAVDRQASETPVQVFSFNLPIKGEENAELKVFYNKGRQKDSPDEFKMSLFLEMDKIGEIRSDFFHLKDELAITFFVQDDKVKEHFQDNFQELEEILEPVFKTLNLNILVSKDKLAEFETEEIQQEIISDKEVDVKV